ncbi:hypothetical protein AQJ30_30225 [Streptomyces longwoodensis]|uniref:L,D-transpeptidase n=1 Tax=Streptomyces longwoodensis TaxID=68231 RepID=A0A101QQL6_9ACTN|nr:hypothetical protein AQJ30_30225 [Streptomyces longwoodensis]
MAGLTATALATVGFLAWQAAAHVPADLAHPADAARTSGISATKAPRDSGRPAALPSGSGKGERVVYSVDDDRVWLVGAAGTVLRTFTVAPGALDPSPGAYAVTSRANRVTGTDGTPVEHVVRFATAQGLAIGFSAAVDGSAPAAGADVRTGAIRASRADGNALWDFATLGRRVVVIR